MTPNASSGSALAVDMILDRIAASDTLTRSLNQQLLERVDKVEAGQDEIKGRLQDLEHKDYYRDGQLDVQHSAAQGGFRILLVIVAAFAAGFAGSLFEKNVAAIPPTHKQDVSIHSPIKEDT